MERIEKTILRNLLHNEEFTRKTLPFIKPEYFDHPDEKIVYLLINGFFEKYNALPTKEVLTIELDKNDKIKEEQFKSISGIIAGLNDKPAELNWIVDTTERFCKDQAVYNAVASAVAIIDGKDPKRGNDAIPTILSDALAVSFDNSIGHDYFDDSDERFDYYHDPVEKIPFNIAKFNEATKGGIKRKSLNVLMAGTGVGKTLCLCHMAAGYLMDGLDVLYITMEVDENEIAERVEVNLMNIEFDMLRKLDKSKFDNKLGKIRKKTQGTLIVKEFPDGSAGAGHFRHLIHELKQKKKMVPNVIMIDYINICKSMQVRRSAGTYEYVKQIAVELRGLSKELNIPIWSATQANREGNFNSDPTLSDQSDSFGLPMTADLEWALSQSEQMAELNQYMVKQLKSRYDNINKLLRFVIGVDTDKQKLYDVEQSAQNLTGQEEDKPVMDSTAYGERWKEDEDMSWKTKKMGRRGVKGLTV